mgnify:CR=1 FL=1
MKQYRDGHSAQYRQYIVHHLWLACVRGMVCVQQCNAETGHNQDITTIGTQEKLSAVRIVLLLYDDCKNVSSYYACSAALLSY